MPRRVQLMKQSPLHPLLLSAVADSLRRPFPEIRLLPDGAFAARDGRPGTLTGGNLNAWNLSSSGAERVLDQWRRRETPLVIDYEHQSLNARHNGQPAPAAGWIESLRYEPGQGLFASILWTEGAKGFHRTGRIPFHFPWLFSFNPQKRRRMELKGAALTNVPALDGLGAVAATEDFPPSDNPQPETAMNALNRLKQLLGLPEDAAEETLQAELDKLESLLTPANPAASDPSALPGQPPFPHQADPLPGNARPTLFDFLQACHPQAALTSLVRANTALRDQLSVALSVTHGDRVAGASNAPPLAERRLSRGLVGWATALGRQNPDALETYLAAVAPIAALSSFQSAGSRPVLSAPAASSLSDEERFVCAQLGLSEAEYLAVRG